MSITRYGVGPRLSGAVAHGDTVYLAGQVADDYSADIGTQARQVLAAVDRLLKEAGSDKSQILQAQVWLSSMAYYADFNKVWDAWVTPGHTPARACTEARLAHPDIKCEVMVTAARKK